MKVRSLNTLIGVYCPSPTDKLMAAVYGVLALVFVVANVQVSGGVHRLDRLDEAYYCGFVLVALLMCEVNLRTVTVDDEQISQHSPLRIYRQKFSHNDLGGIRLKRMAGGDIVEVFYEGQWIVFCSNRTFRRQMLSSYESKIRKA